MKYDQFGREIPDTTPVELPVRFKRAKAWSDSVRQLVAVELSRQAEAEGKESFEESLDFEVEDDEMPRTVHERRSDVEEELLQDMQEARKVAAMRRLAAKREKELHRGKGTGEVDQPARSGGESKSGKHEGDGSKAKGAREVGERSGRAGEGSESRGGSSVDS